MKKYVLNLVVLTAILLASCSPHKPNDGVIGKETSAQSLSEETSAISLASYKVSDYTVYSEKSDYTPAKFEPDYGCYIGAYVLANSRINYDMERFDALTGKQHALSVYNLRLGEEFPLEWVLECIAAKKTPYFIVKPPNEYSIFQEDRLAQAAKSFGEISTPIFMDFYPNPQGYTGDYKKYADFYRQAKKTFNMYASNVIFVFSADSGNVYDINLYYPGDEYVNWVGISMFQPLYVNGAVNLRNYMEGLDYVYFTYQHRKPILISQLAISSYSTADHRYASKEAAKKITDLYRLLKEEYPRVKAVNYLDFDNVPGAPKDAERDDFSVTQDKTVLTAYSEAISDNWFLSETKREHLLLSERFKSPFTLLEDENFKYIPHVFFESEGISTVGIGSVIINGETYLSTDALSRSEHINCRIDNMNKTIIIKAKL